MSPTRRPGALYAFRLPRTCGDEPDRAFNLEYELESAPHLRG